MDRKLELDRKLDELIEYSYTVMKLSIGERYYIRLLNFIECCVMFKINLLADNVRLDAFEKEVNRLYSEANLNIK